MPRPTTGGGIFRKETTSMPTASSLESPAATALAYTFTSESVTEGHPDKVCDYIADSVLDACLEQDTRSRVACEVLAKESRLVLAGEISTDAQIDRVAIARQAIREIGYVHPEDSFRAHDVEVHDWITAQSIEIAQGVDRTVAAEQ